MKRLLVIGMLSFLLVGNTVRNVLITDASTHPVAEEWICEEPYVYEP